MDAERHRDFPPDRAMNRKQRRAAKAAARRQRIDPVVAVHESGHCVGRILVAESLGWRADEVIHSIELHPVPLALGKISVDGTRELRSQAITHGMMVSKPMDRFLMERLPERRFEYNDIRVEYNDIRALIPDMRATGIDIDWWYRAKCIEAVFGPMAEAKFLEKPFDDVWNSYSSEDDIRMLAHYGVGLCEMNTDEINEAVSRMVYVAEQYIAMPKVWRAILTLAERLKFGGNDGKWAAAIVIQELQEADHESIGGR
jgi:hypothetical protein